MSTPAVVNGIVQRKNRAAETPSFYNTPQDVPAVHRERPGPGHRHLLRKHDIVEFISILPEWAELSRGLNAIVLACGPGDADGWYREQPGIVVVCAWPRAIWVDLHHEYVGEHRRTFDRLGVKVTRKPGDRGMRVGRFSEAQARAYQLLHILLHELGHHHDRMTTRAQRETGRGESYAEQYALRYEDLIWERYCQVFGAPA
jgi:hypothetical protein